MYFQISGIQNNFLMMSQTFWKIFWKIVPVHVSLTLSPSKIKLSSRARRWDMEFVFIWGFSPEFTQSPTNCNEFHRRSTLCTKYRYWKRNISTSASVQFHSAQAVKWHSSAGAKKIQRSKLKMTVELFLQTS